MRKNNKGGASPVRQHLAVTGALLATTVLGGVTQVAQAQQAEGNGDAKGVRPLSVTQPPLKFDIPAGSVGDAIKAFEQTTGMDVRIRIMTLRGLTADSVQGEMTAEQALRKILAKTDIVYRFVDTNTVLLLRGRNQRDVANHEIEAVAVTGKKAVAVKSAKYTEPVRDIPQSITVVSQDVLKEQHVTSLRDAVRNVAGITMNAGENGGMPGDKFNLRGFSAASDIYVDGVRDIGGYSRESYNIEQVEVTKGPNGAYSGRGSTGGTINVVTKTPQATDRRVAEISLGSADQRRATVDLNQTLAPLGFAGAAVRLNAMTNEAGVAENEIIKNKGWGVAPSLELGLNSKTQFLLQYNQSAQDNMPSYGIETYAGVPAFDTRKFYGLRSLDFEKVRANQTIARIDHSISDHLRIRNQTSRGHTKIDRIVTSAVPILGTTNPDSARRSPKTHINDNIVVANQTNLNANFTTGVVEHSVVSGFEISHEKSLFGRYTITGTAPAISNLNTPSADADFHPTLQATVARNVKATSVGAYLFETVRPHAKVELTAGVRWDQYKPEYTDSASLASGFKATKSSAVTGRGGIVFKPVEDGSIYASYGTSFNPSNENLSADALSANSHLPPEKSRSYELGTKWELFKQRMLSTFAIFRTDKVNARTTDPTNSTLQILAGKQRVEGAEAGVTGDILPSLNVLANYSYMESKYLKSNTASQTNTPFTNVPKHSANAWATYKIVPGISAGGGVRMVGKRLLRLTDTTRVDVPSYTALDAMASYQVSSQIDLQLNLYNLTDKLYYDSGRMWVPAAGRSVSITTSLKF